MSYLSKMKQEIKKDIAFCNELLKKDYVAGKEFSNIIGKYNMKYPNFENGFKISGWVVSSTPPNEIENLKILKSKLEYLLIEIENPQQYQSEKEKTILNVTNTANNTNNINLNMNIDEIKNNVEDNTFLSDDEKNILLEKLEEIIELQKSKETRSKKWSIAKNILAFLLDKGADIAIMYIPQILKAIQ